MNLSLMSKIFPNGYPRRFIKEHQMSYENNVVLSTILRSIRDNFSIFYEKKFKYTIEKTDNTAMFIFTERTELIQVWKS